MTDDLDLPEMPELPEFPELPGLEGLDVVVCIRPASDLQDMTKPEWGPIKWRELEFWADSIPCAECRDFAVKFTRANHDLVNIHLDKPVYDEANLREYASTVEQLVKKAGLR